MALGVLVVVDVAVAATADGGSSHHRSVPISDRLDDCPTPSALSGPLPHAGVNIATSSPTFLAMTATGPNDLWVLAAEPGDTAKGRLAHYDGRSWSVLGVPKIYAAVGIAAPAPDDVWVVGESRTILHWNGTAWSHVALPRAPGVELSAVSASGRDNVWIVGHRYGVRLPANSVGSHSLAYHFDGQRWSIVPTPNPDYSANLLTDVMAVSKTYTLVAGISGQDGYTLQWDGRAWHKSLLPAPAHHPHVSITGLGMAGIQPWAVGQTGGPGFGNPVYLKWTGDLWQLVPMDAIDYNTATPQSISGATPFDVWAAGALNGGQIVLTHFTGHAFNYVDLPLPADVEPDAGDLTAVLAFSSTDVWVVGGAVTRPIAACDPNQRNLSLIEHWGGHSWTPVRIPGIATVSPPG